MARAIPQTTAIDAIARKVVVPLDHHGLVALCDNRPLPDCPDSCAAGGAGSNCALRCIYDAHAGNNRRSFVRISVTAVTLSVRLIRAASSDESAAILARLPWSWPREVLHDATGVVRLPRFRRFSFDVLLVEA